MSIAPEADTAAPSHAPGKRFFGLPETEGAELPLKRSFFPAETASRLCAPHNRGYSSNHGKSRLAWDCVVVDAAPIEPVSAGRFPGNREINRESWKNLFPADGFCL